MTASLAELTLATQLEQAGIPFQTEYEFAPEEWCRANGFLSPVRQLPRKWRADFLVRSHRSQWDHLLIEIDGGGYVAGRHSRGGGMEADAEKQSAAAILGYRVIRCTPKQVDNGTALEWIRQALGLERPEMVAVVEDQVRLLQEGVPNVHRRLSGETS